jgi:MerR family transcriptional regulator, thiopeptide resistance regulator
MMVQPEERKMSGKVGEVARRTGISIRTLHYYDEIGLVSPSQHTEAGHRLYTDNDVQRLQQILILRALGFSLDKIRHFLATPEDGPFLDVIDQQTARLRKEIDERLKVVNCLEKVAEKLRTKQHTTIDEIIALMEALEMIDKYYTREQLDELKARADALGEGGMQKAQEDWKELIEEVKMEIDRGANPTDESVQQLARRWMDLIEMFTGGSPGIAKSLQAMYREEGASKASLGVLDEGTMAFMQRAIAALRNGQD